MIENEAQAEEVTLVIRVIRSFPHRNIRNIVLKSVPLRTTGIRIFIRTFYHRNIVLRSVSLSIPSRYTYYRY